MVGFARVVGLATVLVLAPIAASALQGQTADERAAFIAQSVRPRAQLRQFILRVVAVTTTGQIIIRQLGPEKAATFFGEEADKEVEKYGEQWERNMVSSWREALTADELTAATHAAEARDDAAIAPYRAKVGVLMQQKSSPLLQKATEEVLASCFKIMKPAS